MGRRYLNSTAFIRKEIRIELMTKIPGWSTVFVMKGVTFQTTMTCLVPNMAQVDILVWVIEAVEPVLIFA